MTIDWNCMTDEMRADIDRQIDKPLRLPKLFAMRDPEVSPHCKVGMVVQTDKMDYDAFGPQTAAGLAELRAAPIAVGTRAPVERRALKTPTRSLHVALVEFEPRTVRDLVDATNRLLAADGRLRLSADAEQILKQFKRRTDNGDTMPPLYKPVRDEIADLQVDRLVKIAQDAADGDRMRELALRGSFRVYGSHQCWSVADESGFYRSATTLREAIDNFLGRKA